MSCGPPPSPNFFWTPSKKYFFGREFKKKYLKKFILQKRIFFVDPLQLFLTLTKQIKSGLPLPNFFWISTKKRIKPQKKVNQCFYPYWSRDLVSPGSGIFWKQIEIIRIDWNYWKWTHIIFSSSSYYIKFFILL